MLGGGSAAVSSTWTADGLPETETSDGAVWTNTYNKRRLNERESFVYGGVTYSIDRLYDANGSLLQLTYPDGSTVAYAPNQLGEPRQVGVCANAVAFHPNGALAGFNYGATTTGISHSTIQNERGLPERSIDGGVINDQYTYDAKGNVTAITDLLQPSVSSRTMVYDNLDRLTSVSAPNLWGTASYGYDALDNLTSMTLTGGISARSTIHNINPATNRLDSITNGPPGYNFTYSYDSQGNVKQRNAQVYVFDMANRMKSATGKATYKYDGFGHRVSVVGSDGVNRVQVYSQGGHLLYIAPSGGTATKYVYLHNHILAEVTGSTVTYDHTDALGSPVGQTNSTGTILSRTRYEPYGYVVGGTPRTIGFTGHVNDNDTGLIYMQQRYYDPFAGRMLSIDPVTTDANTGGSFNRYAYANNNPYKYVDPDGRQERAAEAFGDRYRYDMASGNSDVYKPFETPVIAVTVGMVVGPPIAAAIIAGAPAEAAVAAGAAGKATSIVAKNGVEIKSIARHAVDRAIGDGGKRAGVGPKGILDSLKNPLKITETKTDELGRASQRFIGKDATTAVNPETGKIVSVNPTSTKTAEKLIRAAEQ
jgi:RHS repeat-associated protein